MISLSEGQGISGKIILSEFKGIFRSQDFPFDQEYEDMGALLFDYDGDNDLDLYVVSGGTFAGKNSALYKDRFYINTGKGKFIKIRKYSSGLNSSGSVVTASDFDRDGDLDLFVGGRILPLHYPYPPKRFYLKTGMAGSVDVTAHKAAGLSEIGMVNVCFVD